MTTEIYTEFDNPQLRSAWERLEQEAAAFPQSRWHWCASWWRRLGRGRRPHIVVVRDRTGRPVGLAPFLADSLAGVKYLRSLPENYGDFYTILIAPQGDAETVYQEVFAALRRFSGWRSVLLFNVNSGGPLADYLTRSLSQAPAKRLCQNVVTDLCFDAFEGYLAKLSKNRRRIIRKKQHAFEQDFSIANAFSVDKERYLAIFDETFALQAKRWEGDRPRRSPAYVELVRETHARCFEQGQMCLLEVRANGRLAAYRLGFLHDGTYYDWNTSYDLDFEGYSPGSLSIAYLMEQLAAIGIRRVDFMAGYYDYKVSYSPAPVLRENRLYLLGDGSLRARLVAWYFLNGRDRLKGVRDQLVHLLRRRK